jgi:ribosomal protein S27E
MRGLDNWITSGRYSSNHLDVTCSKCGETTAVFEETEYGMTTWTPEECSKCKHEFGDDDQWEQAEPDYDDAVDISDSFGNPYG